MKQYPAYKPSGIDWIGEVPEHWEVKKISWISTLVTQGGNPNYGLGIESDDYRVLKTKSLYDHAIHYEESDLISKETYEQEQKSILRSNDFLIAIVGHGSIGKSNVFDPPDSRHYIYSRSLGCIRFIEGTNVHFFKYLFQSPRGKEIIELGIKGSTGQEVVQTTYLKDLRVPLPTALDEQAKIIDYLDRKTALIDALIEKTTQKIALLQEQRTALINQAVTKGLDPGVPMKDSGVEWIGEVPRHWEVKRLKHLADGIIDTEHKTVDFVEGGKYLVVRTSNVKGGKLILENSKFTDENGFQAWTRRGVPRPGDILFTREAPAGEACIIPGDMPLCMGQRMVWIQVNRQKLNASFGVHSIYSELGQEFIRNLSGGSTVAHFNMPDIGNIPILIPPKAEQDKIVLFIEGNTLEIDTLIQKEQRKITLLKEYRQTLISEVVTGKIDVRDA